MEQDALFPICCGIGGQYSGLSYCKVYGTGIQADSFLVQAHRPFEIDEETFRSPIGSVSLRHAAVQSGLAVWGKNTLALTKEYGPALCFLDFSIAWT